MRPGGSHPSVSRASAGRTPPNLCQLGMAAFPNRPPTAATPSEQTKWEKPGSGLPGLDRALVLLLKNSGVPYHAWIRSAQLGGTAPWKIGPRIPVAKRPQRQSLVQQGSQESRKGGRCRQVACRRGTCRPGWMAGGAREFELRAQTRSSERMEQQIPQTTVAESMDA